MVPNRIIGEQRMIFPSFPVPQQKTWTIVSQTLAGLCWWKDGMEIISKEWLFQSRGGGITKNWQDLTGHGLVEGEYLVERFETTFRPHLTLVELGVKVD